MANVTVGTPIGFSAGLADKRKLPNATSSSLVSFPDTKDVASLRSALQTANGAYYTNARLDVMSVNDMMYALRLIKDPTSI